MPESRTTPGNQGDAVGRFDGGPVRGRSRRGALLGPRRRLRHGVAVGLWVVLALGGLSRALGIEASDRRGFPPWKGRDASIEALLLEADLVAMEPIGRGVTRPYRVLLEGNGVQMAAIWKPIDARAFDYQESYRSEVAAYRLSRALGLDMVPPTVERRIGNRRGSLQMWVDGFQMYVDRIGTQPPPLRWSEQVARMSFFDQLIDNPDRNAGNFLVNEEWQIVLIDHSRALSFDRQGPARTQPPPNRFDRGLVEQTRTLDEASLEQLLGDLLPRSERRTFLRRRDRLIAHVDRMSAERGVLAFFP